MRSAIAMPTAVASPWPSGPVVVSTPVVKWYSGWPGVRLSSWRNFLMSSSDTAGALPPSQWGTEAWLRTHFDEHDFLVQVTRRIYNFRYRSAAHFIDTFRAWYGPMHKAFAALPPDGAQALEHDLIELINRSNRAGEKSLVVPGEYLEVVITRR